MEIFDAIMTRRSIRRYTEKKIDDEMVNKILRAAMNAPSAVNKQPWHFVVFKAKEIRDAIVKVHPSSEMLKEADRAILICYDEKLQHDVGYGVIDCSNATVNILLAAHGLGLGACWIGICPREKRIEALKEIFHLPENIVPFAVVSLGYPAESKSASDRFKADRVHIERW